MTKYRSDPEWLAARERWIEEVPGEDHRETYLKRMEAIMVMHRIEMAWEVSHA